MKRFLALFSLLLLVQCSSEPTSSNRIILNLHDRWVFRQLDADKWQPAEVPGCVHTDLLAAGLIDDPFYRDNEKKLQWIERTDWEYQTTFSLQPEMSERNNVELVFRGLDTYADVYLNGEQVLRADNMFREWRIDCKEQLQPEANILRIHFRSPVNEVLPKMEAMDYILPAGNDAGPKTSPHTRKAPYHFGWDWGPRFVTCGIWQPVFLEAWNAARIADVNFVTEQLDEDAALIRAKAEVIADDSLRAVLSIFDQDSNALMASRTVELSAGQNLVMLEFRIDDPVLWWPNGLGNQRLYSFRTRLDAGGDRVDEAVTRSGLRTVELRQNPDEWGESYEFVVNGVPVFAKGGNWIPADNFLNRVTAERYRHLLHSCKDANMNMLRVWGGGIYENDVFYDLCDELGILVWQDFMFACSMYPADPGFLENVEQEAIYQVKRLRNHPSLALWCGNNEIETGWYNWGWKEQYPGSVGQDYAKIFHQLLPTVCQRYDPTRKYWPSSPSSGGKANADAQEVGDVHYWGVWHAAAPFESYRQQFPRFLSEYGFQSFPEMKTVLSFALPEDLDLESPVMSAHQKHPRGNALILEYLLRGYPWPKDFAAFLYLSQVLQAEGIKIGTEHYRRLMPRCMGTLYWQINDCWPVASWSSIDYYGRWKAEHYYARRFYDDILVSPSEDGGTVQIYIVSDRTTEISGNLQVRLIDFDGRTIKEWNKAVRIPPLRSAAYLSLTEEDLLSEADPTRSLLYMELGVAGKLTSTNRQFFEIPKNLAWPSPVIKASVRRGDDGLIVELAADKFASNVFLCSDRYDGFFRDNYFDLMPGRAVTVVFQTEAEIAPEAFRRDLKIISLVDAF
ncbi:MAG: glycoside hydrolase family 2 protein [Candidatus Neomarinimicrobiota bacterium]